MGSRRHVIAASALAVVAMVAAACGNDAVAGSPTSAPTNAAAPSSTVPPITTSAPAPTTPPAAPTPPPLAAKGPRPANGEVRPTKRSGLGELDIDNGTDSDAYVTLARGPKVVLTAYVWKGSSAKVTRVADGDYTLYYSVGDGWNSDVRRFTAGVSAAKFDETLAFRTTRTTSAIYTIGLQPTVSGNASTSDVSDDDIPR